VVVSIFPGNSLETPQIRQAVGLADKIAARLDRAGSPGSGAPFFAALRRLSVRAKACRSQAKMPILKFAGHDLNDWATVDYDACAFFPCGKQRIACDG
jgi:hypothetical protein